MILILTSSWRNAHDIEKLCSDAIKESHCREVMRAAAIYGTDASDSNEVGNGLIARQLTVDCGFALFQIGLINGCDVLVATPYCLLRMLIKRRATDLKRICHIVSYISCTCTLKIYVYVHINAAFKRCLCGRCSTTPTFCAIPFTSSFSRSWLCTKSIQAARECLPLRYMYFTSTEAFNAGILFHITVITKLICTYM